MNSVPLLVPTLGAPSAKVSHWYAQLGDIVQEGERLVELLLPGLTIDLHAPAKGRLDTRTRLLGDTVSENDTLGTIQPLAGD
jgi:pyruvate/2-oxoglutarate dehydrogenase complex dihydrolipoamide acyltransferase (E2) component